MLEIKKQLLNKIKELKEKDSRTIVVLKGIDIKLINESYNIDIDTILENKFMYTFSLQNQQRNIITYDEYLALYDLILSQYKKVIIIENNMYINYYPLQVKISKEKVNGLLTHYNEEIEGEKFEIGDISELCSIYGNIKCINDRYYITYSNFISNEKEEVIELFEEGNYDIEKVETSISKACYEILDEEDYLIMIDHIFNKDIRKVYVIEKNSGLNKKLLRGKLKVLVDIFKDNIEIMIGKLSERINDNSVNNKFLDILKTHWGHSSFRKIKVYNMDALENKEKIIEEISQSDIINNIVEETEKCMKQKDYRDIFVTAPTGAGKSAIFQIPAIYLANKHELFTIVISPLIGLMKDQVNNLQLHKYSYAHTINSDISPIVKQEIINDIADKKCNILYISPESLLSKSDLEQIIGDRILGLLVVDEAHIVTTWGKQFRPDYWYLGDHLRKIKKAQLNKKGMSFVIATFTATAIYGGIENMYEETVQSLKMIDPITYLGYVKREDIDINVRKTQLIKGKTEYELNKFDQLIEKIDKALILDKKMLIYFPTVALINRFSEYCIVKDMGDYVTKYHGQLKGYEKEENYQRYLNGEIPIMLATKAFGMGIDIDDIEVVAHFAPTGNVCDYVQEIGRAARKPTLRGEAYYKFMKNDFKHINKLHGISMVKDYQLVQVIKKVYDLQQENLRKSKGKHITKKKNEMLVDAENFAHIFKNPFFDEDDGINKVKTAMLLIQKDFERRFSFSPFHIRPIPLFEIGFFKINSSTQKKMINKYGSVLKEVDDKMNICSVNLKKIWEKGFVKKYSFPKFKYLLYSNDEELGFKYVLTPALSVEISFEKNYLQQYDNCFNAIKRIVNNSIRNEKFYSIDCSGGLVNELMNELSINKYKAKSIIETILAAMSVYQRDYSRSMHGKVMIYKSLKSGENKYKFMNGASGFFRWIDRGFKNICDNISGDTLYLINEGRNNSFKEKLMILGLLETFEILIFSALGGKNSQIYIYVNQTKTMKEIIEKPFRYKNRLLELVGERHKISVEMLTYLFENEFNNEEMWNRIEDYFLGIIPQKVIENYENKTGKKLELQ